MNIICTRNEAQKRNYTAFAIGNGDLSLAIDYEGMMSQNPEQGMNPEIFRAGIRYDKPVPPLVSFGYFVHEIPEAGRPVDWRQAVDLDDAVCRCRCRYRSGLTVDTEVFCHLEFNIVAIRKRVSQSVPLTLKYHLAAPRMKVVATPDLRLDYVIDTYSEIRDSIYLLADREVMKAAPRESDFTMTSSAGETVFYLAFGQNAADQIHALGYDGLLESHRRAWSRYWAESTLRCSADRMSATARLAEYHLRISTTRWSIPTGIFNTHWSGRYFGFDEFFAASGLLAAGHHRCVRNVAQYRYDHLRASCERAYCYFGEVAQFARYTWESVEMPGVEGAPPGFWLEHIFHMAHIALTEWHYFLASKDREFLRQCGYPVIRACAEFFRIQSVVDYGGGRVVIGKCTDLERLGPARENAFMTTCGAISTLRAAAVAAETLDLETFKVAEWRNLAEMLQNHLPRENDRYIPYPGCQTGSIGMLSGIFPYQALPCDDEFQRRAVDHFCTMERGAGNMYPVGTSMCTWYAAWKAIVLLHLGRIPEAERVLEAAAEETGCFGEIYELYEKAERPWFTTAEGTFLRAVIELRQSDR